MSQQDTYRPAVLPSEAVMMPAVEKSPDAPPPAAQEEMPAIDDPTRVPAKSQAGSATLERLRNRMRNVVSHDVQWISASEMPLDRPQTPPEQPVQRMAARRLEAQEPVTRPQSITNGSALTTLMRSAARQYKPAPSLNGSSTARFAGEQMSVQMPAQRMSEQPMMQMHPMPPTQQPQMRGALRRVVRDAQQTQSGASMPTVPVMPSTPITQATNMPKV